MTTGAEGAGLRESRAEADGEPEGEGLREREGEPLTVKQRVDAKLKVLALEALGVCVTLGIAVLMPVTVKERLEEALLVGAGDVLPLASGVAVLTLEALGLQRE